MHFSKCGANLVAAIERLHCGHLHSWVTRGTPFPCVTLPNTSKPGPRSMISEEEVVAAVVVVTAVEEAEE